MIPGEYFLEPDDLVANVSREPVRLRIRNRGDRPVQVGSHFHMSEVNSALELDRDKARGMRLNLPSGTATRFEPGEEKEVELVPYAGSRQVWGHRGLTNGEL